VIDTECEHAIKLTKSGFTSKPTIVNSRARGDALAARDLERP